MEYKAFTPKAAEHFIARIKALKENQPAKWGSMNVSQMMKHCTIPYLQIKNDNDLKAPWLVRQMMQLFFKKDMVNEIPFSKNLPTASFFRIKETPDFEKCKQALIAEVSWFGNQDPNQFEGKKHSTLGKLTTKEWDNLVYKHLNHHLKQFGV